MTRLLTCKQFLHELNDFLDETLDPAIRADLQRHVTECPNCWVVYNTTEKTLKVFKGMEAQPVPEPVRARLMEALERKMKSKRGGCGGNVEV
jgi:anti-sigma factor (TIGR02949 family)